MSETRKQYGIRFDAWMQAQITDALSEVRQFAAGLASEDAGFNDCDSEFSAAARLRAYRSLVAYREKGGASIENLRFRCLKEAMSSLHSGANSTSATRNVFGASLGRSWANAYEWIDGWLQNEPREVATVTTEDLHAADILRRLVAEVEAAKASALESKLSSGDPDTEAEYACAEMAFEGIDLSAAKALLGGQR